MYISKIDGAPAQESKEYKLAPGKRKLEVGAQVGGMHASGVLVSANLSPGKTYRLNPSIGPITREGMEYVAPFVPTIIDEANGQVIHLKILNPDGKQSSVRQVLPALMMP